MSHPSQVLFRGAKPLPMRPAVDPYAGSEKLMTRALQWHSERGPMQQHGQLHVRASYRYYGELLARAQATGMRTPEAARQRFFA